MYSDMCPQHWVLHLWTHRGFPCSVSHPREEPCESSVPLAPVLCSSCSPTSFERYLGPRLYPI